MPELVMAKHWPDSTFINLPMVYPGGDNVTVQVARVAGGFRVSDGGFAVRQAENFGHENGFTTAAKTIIASAELNSNARTIFVDVPIVELYRAICDVGAVSWKVAEKLCVEADSEERDDELVTGRLRAIFGTSSVLDRPVLVGASTSNWQLTARVKHNGRELLFQSVSGSAYSIYRTNSAFDDIADVGRPLGMIAVVPSRALLGKKLGLLSRNARVVERAQPDSAFLRAANLGVSAL